MLIINGSKTKPFTLAAILTVTLVVALMAIAFGKFGIQGLRFRAWVLVAGFGV